MIRDAFLRTLKLGLIAAGVANPNVSPGSDWYVVGQAVGNQLAVTEANAAIKADELMPDTAQDEGLLRLCAVYGLSARPASGSIGPVVITCSQTTSVATGAQLVDGKGQTYQVVVGGLFSNQATIIVKALSTGSETNLVEGTVLRWVSTPAFADEKAPVGPGGLVNGAPAENNEVLRQRLYDRLRNAPGSGNASHVQSIALQSHPSVQSAFVYPAIQGGATAHVACLAAPTSTNKSRDIALATMNGSVAPYIVGFLPEHVYSVITTATNVDADVAFGLVLPESPAASPPGPGGGWLNPAPWPAPSADAGNNWRCTVTAVTSNSQFTVDALTAPTAGVSQIAWLSPYEWKLYRATVASVTGSSGAYVITLDSPFVGIAVGCYIWPDCENAQAYCDSVLAAFALMGPGEKTTNASALIRGFRRPRPSLSWPYSLGGHLTKAITANSAEVASAQFFHRTDSVQTPLTGPAGLLVPQVPVSISDAPKVFRPRHIAFYRVP